MSRTRALVLFSLLAPAHALAAPPAHRLRSPDGRLELTAGVRGDGAPFYRLDRNKRPVILPSSLGLKLKRGEDLSRGFEVQRATRRTEDRTWTTVWGQQARVHDHHNELALHLRQREGEQRRLVLVFRLFDDGLGFRYVVPKQRRLDRFVITSEETRFTLPGDPTCFWIPDDYDHYEALYTRSRCSRIGKTRVKRHPHTSRTDRLRGANTPLTVRTPGGLHLAFHEAALVDYAGMTLVPERPARGKSRHPRSGPRGGDDPQFVVKSVLVPWPNGDRVRARAPMKSPWRAIIVAERPGDLITSTLVLNLNEPSKIKDTRFIKPMKYVGIWWGMHLGITTWGMAGGRHGATTAETRRHIDFAARNGVGGVLVEGWNRGWESWAKGDNFDFQTPYPDFDLRGLAAYARKRGVMLVGHHETGGQVASYERHLERAFALYRKLGIRAVKTGYAGKIRGGHYHHGQYMVRHYVRVVRAAARHGIMIDAHEPIKPTGLGRTYPNLLTGEGVRGMEWNAWSKGNPPRHTVMLPFTRMLAGPLDYTPGIFDLRYERYPHQVAKWDHKGMNRRGRTSTTLAKQLALYVVLFSPLQMAADLIENYEGHPAFQLIREVPVSWERTLVLDGRVGEHVTIARQRRGGDDWYIGSVTDARPRRQRIKLDFLHPKKTYIATFYRDGARAHFRTNPGVVEVEQRRVAAGEQLTLSLRPGGGQAIAIRAVRRDHPAWCGRTSRREQP